ncbi:MAG: F0F1 ATP synthase subunit gamma [Puia sp.]|nr:F0F1 ATP synthase subunit gamma [Puia sp.]
MSDSLESLRKKIKSASDLGSVARIMKVMAASNIGQYEMAVRSLAEYYRTIQLGLLASFYRDGKNALAEAPDKNTGRATGVIVFGSDQGLVGRFNDSLASFVAESLGKIPGTKKIWAAGERLSLPLADLGLVPAKVFPVPNSVAAITSLVGQMLLISEESREKKEIEECYIFHNRPGRGSGYEAVSQRFLPLDGKWKQELSTQSWPSKNLPQVMGAFGETLSALLREYLFVSLYKACAESLASENAGRLEAMQRAEKNIDDMLSGLGTRYNGLRQRTIDEELFDVIAGFEALPRRTENNQQ